MTIDERLDRLTERHEALAQSVELLLITVRETRATVSEIAGTVNALAATVRETTATVSAIAASVSKLVDVTNRDAVDIRALARIAESHERRITDIEGRQA
jgi:archaellum component FlaC